MGRIYTPNKKTLTLLFESQYASSGSTNGFLPAMFFVQGALKQNKKSQRRTWNEFRRMSNEFLVEERR